MSDDDVNQLTPDDGDLDEVVVALSLGSSR